MKFDPLKKDIYTDNGVFIKRMDCPYKMNWNKMEIINRTTRKCSNCNHSILDTASIPDEELLKLVRLNPGTCLKIDLNQQNIKVISNGILGWR